MSEAVPDKVVAAFAGRAGLSLAELAAAMEMDQKTLRGHVQAGEITYIRKGTGTKRPRRIFTLADVAGFYAAMRRRECPSTGPARRTARSRRRSGTTTSSETVVDFTALRERRRSERHARSSV